MKNSVTVAIKVWCNFKTVPHVNLAKVLKTMYSIMMEDNGCANLIKHRINTGETQPVWQHHQQKPLTKQVPLSPA